MIKNIKKWALAVAIAIVFNLFVNYGLATFYEAPKYEDYCTIDGPRFIPVKETSNCKTIIPSEELQKSCTTEKGYVAYKYDSNGCATEAYCETCSAEYNKVRERYEANASVVLLIIAVLALAAGVILKIESVSTGFLMAGVLGLIITATRYWNHLNNVIRLLLLGAALAVLIWLGYKKIK